MAYRSQIQQSLHYFARPHAAIARAPIETPAAWSGRDFADEAWVQHFDAAQLDEIEAALDALPDERPTADLRRADVPLPHLSPRFDAWRQELSHGRGFVVLRGLPVDRWTQARAERFFWIFGLHLGVPGAQNPQGDLLGHVRDTGAPPDGSVRQYRTAESIDFHCDLADVVGLLCLRAAAEGGRSRIASSVHAYNELLRRHPERVDRLYRPFRLDTKGEGGIPYIPIEPCRFADGQLRTFWHAGYYRSVERLPGITLAAEQRAVLDTYAEIFAEPDCALEMDLQPGDIQLLSNHTIVHGRTGFVDGGAPRHLLRLWLSLSSGSGLRDRFRRERSRVTVLARLAKLRLLHRGA